MALTPFTIQYPSFSDCVKCDELQTKIHGESIMPPQIPGRPAPAAIHSFCKMLNILDEKISGPDTKYPVDLESFLIDPEKRADYNRFSSVLNQLLRMERQLSTLRDDWGETHNPVVVGSSPTHPTTVTFSYSPLGKRACFQRHS